MARSPYPIRTPYCVLRKLSCPVSILHKSIADRYRPVRVADGSITARCRFIKKNAKWLIVEENKYLGLFKDLFSDFIMNVCFTETIDVNAL